MTSGPPATISVILLAPVETAEPSASVRQAASAGAILDVVPAVGPFDRLAAAFAAAASRCAGDLVLAVTPDTELAPDAFQLIAAAAGTNADADAFTLARTGLPPDPAWRGRRVRSHERNLESLRFAQLIAPGALVVRRGALLAALDIGPLPPTADWWRDLTRRITAATRVVPVAAAARRASPLPHEPPSPGFAPPRARPQVLVFGQIEVSTSLYFDALEASPDIAVAFRAPTRLAVDAPHLAAADLVVLVRTLHRFWDEGVIAFLEAARVPWVWFTDDNFQALAAERVAATFFTAPRMRRALAGAAEVWASTPALAAALDPLHAPTKVWGPVLDPSLGEAPAPTGGPLTIAIAGGDFRVGGLAGPALQQLRAIADRQPLRLVTTPAVAAALAPELPRAAIVTQPNERSFRQFIRQWRRHGVDLLLHPAGATANAAYKCPTAVLVAGYLGAVPVVADEPAYADWGEAEGVARLGADGLEAVAARVRDPVWRADLRARLATALAARFDSADRAERLRMLMQPSEVDGAAILASPRFAARRAALTIAYATRRIRDLVKPPG